jgi:hypothetical protein
VPEEQNAAPANDQQDDAPQFRAEISCRNGYDGLVQAFRQRAEQRRIAISGDIHAIAGIPANYLGKLLAPSQLKRIGARSLGPVLGALALKLVVTEDEQALQAYGSRIPIRKESAVHSTAVHIVLSRRFFQKIGAKGGANSRKNMTPPKASRLARRAALARWGKRKIQNGHAVSSEIAP